MNVNVDIDKISIGYFLKFKNDPRLYMVTEITDEEIFATAGYDYNTNKFYSIVMKKEK
jgi:hypothetical protein